MPPAKRILALLLLLGCLARAESVSQGALADGPALASPAPLRVGVYPNAPKLFIDDGGKASGILVELLQEIASAEHWTLEFVACEWQACLQALETGRIDLLPDMAWSEERARRYAFHQVPALHSWSQIYTQRGNKIRSLLDLRGRRIAVLANSIQALTLPNVLAGYGAVLVPADSLERAFALVAAGQADAVAASHYFGDAAAGRHGLEGTPVVFNPARLHYAAMPGRRQAALDAIDRHLASWRADPNSVYFNTLRRWQAGSPAAPLPTSLLWVLAATVGLLLSALAVASWLRTEVAVRTRELRDNERKLATILDSVDSLIYIKDAQSRYQYANGAMCRLLKRPAAAIVGQTDEVLFGPEQAQMTRAGDLAVIEEHQRFVSEERLFDKVYITTKIPLMHGEEVTQLCGITTDITPHKQAEESLRIAATVFQSGAGMCVLSPDAVMIEANRAWGELYGRSAEELPGTPFPHFSLEAEGDDGRERMWDTVREQQSWQGEVWMQRHDGRRYPAWLTVTAVRDASGVLTNFVCTQSDISARKQADEKIVQLAYYDALTGLPNRRLLYERVAHCLGLHGRTGRTGALLFLDMDNFKDLNDSRGHAVGDELLQQVAARLLACTREIDTVARLGGDEFVILLESSGVDEAEAQQHAEVVGEKILSALRDPFEVGGAVHHASCSIGITLCTGQKDELDDLMRRGDLAMYEAKRQGRNTLRFFQPSMEQEVTYRTEIETELRAALLHSQFVLHYQGQVDGDGIMTGAEALVRWQHPTRGLVGPAGFIAIAEASGLIVPLGRWVLRTACEQLALWAQSPATAQFTLAVNVSVRQFLQADFVEETLAIVRASGANPMRLKLELTETLMIEGVEETIGKMRALREHGICFSLDDFGTGYSSLSYLKRLPLDQLKIDQSFVRDVLVDPNDASIARSVVALGKSLGLSIIAEGVETEAQRNFLAGIGCDHWQGYLFSRPVDARTLEELAA
ncbi:MULTISPECIES: EAL domain-containing protein [unclassified Massilia]|uniref:EAL domain-containing protein n=1 Tax=unclassified Massilia TaxID=2609279 RepID=UPI00177C1270|nr:MULTISPECIES: EAL domain-containing protein [unclassified Massilia]MBD8533135.1 EAL domain-containing protein [Massilia sp. CFBP 13647]MBD8676591.1 EAL domain-containing protein [Massilia sp. CFBP 13721]